MNKMKAMLLCLLCAAAVRSYSLRAQTNETTAKIISDFVNKDLPAGKKLFILEIVPGNFTNSGHDEFLVSFDTMRNADLYSRGLAKSVDKAKIFVIDKNKVVVSYSLDNYGAGYKEDGLEKIYSGLLKIPMPELGRSCANGWVGDFNGTGRDQICLYVANVVQYPVIYEFFNGQFKMILPYNEYSFCYIISADARKKNIELEKYKDHKSYTITVRWDSDKLMYEQE